MFNEKDMEYSTKQGKEIPVWKSPKYQESREKAIEIINSGKYGLSESDFWILMNETKSGKMGYTGLIMSHNGCLKVNDALDDKFKAEYVHVDKVGWGGSLVCTYVCPEQGLFEVGEVSSKNCKNDYPYAMAVKRLFDRVVLKLSKLAYAGIYGEAEADEFTNPMVEADAKPNEKTSRKDTPVYVCAHCGKEVTGYRNAGGGYVSPEMIAKKSDLKFGKILCVDCAKKAAGASE